MSTKTKKNQSAAVPKQQIVRPVTIAVEGNKRVEPVAATIVDGTEGELAVTRLNEGDGWAITHVATGRAFPLGEFLSSGVAEKTALRLWKKYPREQMQARRIADVTGALKRSEVLAMAGVS